MNKKLHSSVFFSLIEVGIWTRRCILEKELAEADVSEEEHDNLLKYLEKKETEYMRLQRHKMGTDDFEQLTMIGKGAFGEVSFHFIIRLVSFGDEKYIH